jgi:hypothetical protein
MWKQYQHQILYYQRQMMSTADLASKEIYISVIKDLRCYQLEIEKEFSNVG